MPLDQKIDPSSIRKARLENPKARERDFAESLGASEAEFLAAHVGQGVVRITADMDRLIPGVMRLGEVMALTRNESCVIEKVGVYDDYRGGPHAALVVNHDIDLRMFPSRWKHGFAVEKTLEDGSTRRSLQVFDAAGDAVHKVFLREASILEEWDALVEELREPDQSDTLEVRARTPTEPAKGSVEMAEKLRSEWDKITDTHQFLQMTRKLKMNRLGAYRIAGAPYVRPLAAEVVATVFEKARDSEMPIMVFVGNMGCIEIHTGPIYNLKQMGSWLNVLDPSFHMHLRTDDIAEVWQVTKATRRGDAVSVEAFDKDGGIILQIFGVLAEPEDAARWNEMVFALPNLKKEETV
ncbi:hemin-degrading factor [Shimia sp. CNT1-13L.2]|uniref:hemin-degrading factor n=1 Tax=Shimia sp. CNT1-13L.2 TaxID=2959663 RepID=UPI0020CC7EB0|nr:ChuX/HutX family heme-like substrate-binding protein [Shimia sp. CNT1-13L.2]MCP9484104.1 hemin-degrading factor [Shimia sp. CNT1-13L.2]